MTEKEEVAGAISYEDLAALEDEFDEADVQIIRTQYELQKPLYAKRKEKISQIPNFWPLVLEQAPPEIDQYIDVEDSRIFVESLESIEVTRPELDADIKQGNPRTLRIAFNFRPNEDFEDTQLVKTFWWRRASDGWTGFISEPVKINWKKGKDLTHGLTDMAHELYTARQKSGDMTKKDIPVYNKLKEEVKSWNARNTSFFTWFAWISDRPYVSSEESEKASKDFNALNDRRKQGEKVEMPTPGLEEIAEQFDADIEPMEDGSDLAINFAEELWPNAIKLFTEAQEMEDLSEADFEDDDEEDDEDGPVDIRSLVQNDGPPAKRQKK